MTINVGIGVQSFNKIREGNYFYIDKTSFIKEWWESGDDVTLITRPRRFGKTLNMSMVEQFFSIGYAGRSDLFEGLSIWNEKKYQDLQGTYPVISLSFANIKEKDFPTTRKKICQLLANLYAEHSYLLDSGLLYETDVNYFKRVSESMDDSDATLALYQLSDYLCRYHGRKVIILLDEYDTPMQEAFVHGYWEELVSFIRSMFNSAFKTNPQMARAIMTGITRINKFSCENSESIFSDLNHLEVVTTTSDKYATAFGFTEEEVFSVLDSLGLSGEKKEVKQWYDGFIFGNYTDIYNPWSILNFLDKQKYAAYWANTSANSPVGKILREGDSRIKKKFELLLHGESIRSVIDEQIVYNQLDGSEAAVWSLLLASGYLKVLSYERYQDIPINQEPMYELALTNYEVSLMFRSMIGRWFARTEGDYNDFVEALLIGDLDAMNEYMNRVSLQVFSYFDTGSKAHGAEPERFYHGFVLGLIVELTGRYMITSNRESGFGRYDVMLEPEHPEKDDAIILEFKVKNKRREETLEDTLAAALKQIEEKQYVAQLAAKGFPKEKIRRYGFAFEGKNVLIGE
ncbi:MAG: AAA family ATPase [Lachnospiraceae bacterium]|nr:AAA family ATPase [Lachnospiraceae bacterium]